MVKISFNFIFFSKFYVPLIVFYGRFDALYEDNESDGRYGEHLQNETLNDFQ